MQCKRSMTALIVAVLTAAGCDAADAPLEASGAEQAAAAVQRHDRPGIDGEFARLAREIPGFAGYYFDASGDLVVALTDPRQEGAARAALAGVARGRPAVPGREAAAPSQIRVRGAEYGFAQLSAWHGAFAGLHGVPGGRFIDTDEVANRVRVGVESEEAARMVRQEAARLGIPAGAVIVEVAAPLEPVVLLTDYVRPVKGGLGFAVPGGNCTLGFNAYYVNSFWGAGVGTRAFFTASHCTTTSGGLDGFVFVQGNARIGAELADPSFHTGGACPATFSCRYSDVAAGRYDDSVSWALGSIARTINSSSQTAASITIDAADPQFTIVSNLSAPAVGTYLQKVGITTGRTSGPVQKTCTDYAGTATTMILCQDFVDAYADYGDSGSPVFALANTPGQVSLAGIVWAKATRSNGAGGVIKQFVFSNLNNIDREFGYFVTF